jgi:hypothetical protein
MVAHVSLNVNGVRHEAALDFVVIMRLVERVADVKKIKEKERSWGAGLKRRGEGSAPVGLQGRTKVDLSAIDFKDNIRNHNGMYSMFTKLFHKLFIVYLVYKTVALKSLLCMIWTPCRCIHRFECVYNIIGYIFRM